MNKRQRKKSWLKIKSLLNSPVVDGIVLFPVYSSPPRPIIISLADLDSSKERGPRSAAGKDE